ncbi:MAG: hypothetical protein IKJ79_05355 [Bacteroidaceae bacterium]|nr:hypothetical protein [Bacteroidaceae bacterium]
MMKTEQKERETKKKSRRERLERFIGLVLNGKFFPRDFFARNWGLLLVLVTLFVASIAHRNMYMVQLNKIKKLETQLIDRRTDRILLEYERDENLRLHEISEAIERHNLPLIYSPEPKVEIVVSTPKETVQDEK